MRGRGGRWLALALQVGACAKAAPRCPSAPSPAFAEAAAVGAPQKNDDAQQLAAIELAVNQLRPAIHQCWGAAAAGDYTLHGDLVLQLQWPAVAADVGYANDTSPPTAPDAAVGRDTAHSEILTACVRAVVRAYPWPAIMRGAAFDLPFSFTAPHGQFAIDRRFVTANSGAVATVATLIDAKNSGTGAASLAEVTLAAGSDSGWGLADRDEAWVALRKGRAVLNGAPRAVEEGDVWVIRGGEFRRIAAVETLSFAVLMAPGGVEGVWRAGAVPSRTFAEPPKRGAPPRVFAAAAAQRKDTANGVVRVVVDSSTGLAPFDVSLLNLTAEAAIPTHNHREATEIVYLQAGQGILTVGGVTQDVGPTHVVQIPAGMPHAFVAKAPIAAIQWYAPGARTLTQERP